MMMMLNLFEQFLRKWITDIPCYYIKSSQPNEKNTSNIENNAAISRHKIASDNVDMIKSFHLEDIESDLKQLTHCADICNLSVQQLWNVVRLKHWYFCVQNLKCWKTVHP